MDRPTLVLFSLYREVSLWVALAKLGESARQDRVCDITWREYPGAGFSIIADPSGSLSNVVKAVQSVPRLVIEAGAAPGEDQPASFPDEELKADGFLEPGYQTAHLRLCPTDGRGRASHRTNLDNCCECTQLADRKHLILQRHELM